MDFLHQLRQKHVYNLLGFEIFLIYLLIKYLNKEVLILNVYKSVKRNIYFLKILIFFCFFPRNCFYCGQEKVMRSIIKGNGTIEIQYLEM